MQLLVLLITIPSTSHRSIISLHGSLLNTVTFFPLGLQWLLLSFLVTFFPSENSYFYPLLFFLLLSFQAPCVIGPADHCEHGNEKILLVPSIIMIIFIHYSNQNVIHMYDILMCHTQTEFHHTYRTRQEDKMSHGIHIYTEKYRNDSGCYGELSKP